MSNKTISKTKESNQFDPLLCFARTEDQTPDEVFDMVQERMKTLIGKAISFPKDSKGKICDGLLELSDLWDWSHGDQPINTSDFFMVGKNFGIGIEDVLGTPTVNGFD